MKKTIAAPALVLVAILFINPINAQSLSIADIKAQMVKDWERAKAYTNEYLNTMPADKYSLKPTDSIRSFAQQMLHLAAANVFLMSNGSDEKTPSWLSFTLEQRKSAQEKDSVVYFVNSSYDYCIKAVNGSDPGKWGEPKKLFNRFDVTRYGAMIKAFEHQTHHRGQSTIYIRLAGVKPPEEKLF